jgi:hypothetical protein
VDFLVPGGVTNTNVGGGISTGWYVTPTGINVNLLVRVDQPVLKASIHPKNTDNLISSSENFLRKLVCNPATLLHISET